MSKVESGRIGFADRAGGATPPSPQAVSAVPALIPLRKESPPLPAGPFGLILADPPWRFATFSEKGRGRCPDGKRTNERGNFTDGLNNAPERHYATMTLDEIKALPVDDCAAKDCVLLMWAVDPLLPQALEVGEAWGFTYKTTGFIWAKERRITSARGRNTDDPDLKRFPIGTGYWTRSNPEICLLFTRGKPKRLSAAVRKLLIAPRREHSRKPDEQYERIEALAGGPYLEMFARTPRPGWTSWGNEVDKFASDSDSRSQSQDAAERLGPKDGRAAAHQAPHRPQTTDFPRLSMFMEAAE